MATTTSNYLVAKTKLLAWFAEQLFHKGVSLLAALAARLAGALVVRCLRLRDAGVFGLVCGLLSFSGRLIARSLQVETRYNLS